MDAIPVALPEAVVLVLWARLGGKALADLAAIYPYCGPLSGTTSIRACPTTGPLFAAPRLLSSQSEIPEYYTGHQQPLITAALPHHSHPHHSATTTWPPCLAR